MTEQKRKFSKLCLTGFILTMMPLAVMILVFICEKAPRQLRIFITEKLSPVALILFPLAGFIVSIAGLVTARRDGKKGRGFGIAGAVLPSVTVILIAVMIGTVLFGSGSTKNNEMYGMGGIEKSKNTE